MERLNGTVWKSVSLALRSECLPTSHWEQVLPNALHAIRSLLCTATNETPHERLFLFNRKSSTSTTLPSWLSSPGRVLMKRNIRNSKYDPLVDEVDLLDCNPMYAHVRLRDGRETTVSLHQSAPIGGDIRPDTSIPVETAINILPDPTIGVPPANSPSLPTDTPDHSSTNVHDMSPPTTTSEVLTDHPISSPNLSESGTIPSLESCVNSRPLPYIRTRPYNLRNREA